MNRPPRRPDRLTLYLGYAAIALGLFTAGLDLWAGSGLRWTALIPVALGILAIAFAHRGARRPPGEP